MVRISSYAALLLGVLVCALGPASPSRAQQGCAFVTIAELESAFGIAFSDGRGTKIDNQTFGCMYAGKEAPVLVIIVNATLPPGSELAAWRAQHKANMQGLCELGVPGLAANGTFEIVPDLGEEAYACSLDSYAGPYQVGGMTMLYTAQGPNLFQITVWLRKPGLLEAMAVLTRTALPRLPQ